MRSDALNNTCRFMQKFSSIGYMKAITQNYFVCRQVYPSNIWSMTTSGVASPKIGGGKVFDFRRITGFCLEKRLSKHKMTIFSENFGGATAPLAPPGYA